MHQVLVSKKAEKTLKKLSAKYFDKIVEAIENLGDDPRPDGCKKLKGRPAYRIRVSNYRIIYEVKDDELIVLVITIGHRKDVYR